MFYYNYMQGPHKRGGAASSTVVILLRSPNEIFWYNLNISIKIFERILSKEIRNYFLNACIDLRICRKRPIIVYQAKTILIKLGNQL